MKKGNKVITEKITIELYKLTESKEINTTKELTRVEVSVRTYKYLHK